MSVKPIILNVLIVSFLVIASLLVPNLSHAITDFHLSKLQLQRASLAFGKDGLRRLEQWQDIIDIGSVLEEFEKLEKTNSYINGMSFYSDSKHWQEEDYWATPYEFIASGGGDCEDYAIAKYYTLLAMGVDRKQLRIAYANMEGKDAPHMILLYYQKATGWSFVLDNLENNIQPYHKRNDLDIVYTANEDNVWVVTTDGRFEILGDSSVLYKLSELIAKTRNVAEP